MDSLNFSFDFLNHYNFSNFFYLRFEFCFIFKPAYLFIDFSSDYQVIKFSCDCCFYLSFLQKSFDSNCYSLSRFSENFQKKSHFTGLNSTISLITCWCLFKSIDQHLLSFFIGYLLIPLSLQFKQTKSHLLHRNHNHRHLLRSQGDQETKSCCPYTSI